MSDNFLFRRSKVNFGLSHRALQIVQKKKKAYNNMFNESLIDFLSAKQNNDLKIGLFHYLSFIYSIRCLFTFKSGAMIHSVRQINLILLSHTGQTYFTPVIMRVTAFLANW